MLRYISPSSLMRFYRDRTDFFITYSNRQRLPQTKPMAVGSAFDAFVKKELTGVDYFEEQVEEHIRDWAYDAGQKVFKFYKECGALADLVLEIGIDPKYESTIQGTISTVIGDIPILGKPDLYWKGDGFVAIYDWKVNGYMSKASPAKGYRIVRPKRVAHRQYQGYMCHSIEVGYMPFEEHKTWATQLGIYSWLLGKGDIICGIEQIVGPKDSLRSASLRGLIGEKFLSDLWDKTVHMWKTIKEGDRAIFTDDGLTQDESEAKCEQLRKGFDGSDWFDKMCRM